MNPLSVEPGDWRQIGLRLGLALLAGGGIGWNRGASGKPAGLRTHMLVALGTCLLVLAVVVDLPPGDHESLGRVIQGVAAGVGFLGAGEIFRGRQGNGGKEKVRGLTSAAAIWVTAALGVAAGCGRWVLCLMALAAALAVLVLFKAIEPQPRSRERKRAANADDAEPAPGSPPRPPVA